VQIGLADGRRVSGKVLGRDEGLDLAVIQADLDASPAAPLGDSDLLTSGQGAIAIGNASGVEQSVTVGVVSDPNRSPRDYTYEGLVQTDAAISAANSGGPLLDLHGRVIGISTALLKDPGTSRLGYAVPINVAKDITDQIIRTGHAVHMNIGLGLRDNSPEIARDYHLPASTGAIVTTVAVKTPAARAGFRAGDIVADIDGNAITTSGEFRASLRRLGPGRAGHVTVLRGNSFAILDIRPGEPQMK
jgi:S1-C subfamily serine protease